MLRMRAGSWGHAVSCWNAWNAAITDHHTGVPHSVHSVRSTELFSQMRHSLLFPDDGAAGSTHGRDSNLQASSLAVGEGTPRPPRIQHCHHIWRQAGRQSRFSFIVVIVTVAQPVEQACKRPSRDVSTRICQSQAVPFCHAEDQDDKVKFRTQWT
jgi:hypothetical protein